MKKLFSLIVLLCACASNEKKNQEPFPVSTMSDEEWANYEGRWLVQDGVIRFELALQNGGVGVDSNYKLSESFDSDVRGCGTPSQGLYTTYAGVMNKEFGIRLHDLGEYCKDSYLRFKESPTAEIPDEMFFITRGNDELLPCDDHFKPITTDKRYTLHKRSKLFTVEGYMTFEQDSAKFFERNLQPLKMRLRF